MIFLHSSLSYTLYFFLLLVQINGNIFNLLMRWFYTFYIDVCKASLFMKAAISL